MSRILNLAILFCLVSSMAFSKSYFIRTDGNDSNNGLSNSSTRAWKTIANKVENLKPGDTLWIADGTYSENEIKLASKAGTDVNRVVIKAINPKEAKICSQSDWSALTIKNCTGISIEDLEIYFEVGSTNREYCILAEESNFVTIKNNTVHNAGCSGIQLNTSDNLLVDGNRAYDCASRNEYNGSGISVGFLKAKSNSGATFAVIIRNNISYGNYCDIPFSPGGSAVPTDGNGIILDKWTDNGYTKAGLIENNLCFNNGGKGLHVFSTHNITVRNNTCWHNGYILKKYKNNIPELSSCDANNGTWLNNIGVKFQDANNVAAFTWNGKNVVWTNNMFVGDAVSCSGTGNIKSKADTFPQFTNPSIDGKVADFHLQSTSPAINAGTNTNAATFDLEWEVRPLGGSTDIGCYEYPLPVSININTNQAPESNIIAIYPNPVTDKFNINFRTNHMVKKQLSIWNITGEKVYEIESSSNPIEIIARGVLQSGVYFAAIKKGSQLNSVKFIVE